MLDSCSLKGVSAAALAACLSSCSLQELIIGENPSIGNAGITAICQGLRAKGKGGGTLRRLGLSRCGLTGEEGMTGIAAGLHANVALRELDLRGNAVASDEQDSCAKILTDAVRSNTTLTRMVISGVFTSSSSFSVTTLVSNLNDKCKQLEVIFK